MTPAEAIRLRVFSGPHLGAEIILTEGEHLIGSDDSCDIILFDGLVAPRHAIVRVSPGRDDAPGPRTDISSVDDSVLIDGNPAAEGTPWPPGSPCLLGATMLAWLPAEATAEAWREFIARITSPAQGDVRPEPEHPLASDKTLETPPELADANPGAPTALPPRVQSRKWGRIVRALILLVCLVSLSVSYEFSTQPTGVTNQELAEILKKHGFSTLSAQQDGTVLMVRGEVENDAERSRLLRLAQSLHSSVQLDVHVRADRIEAIAFAFNSRNLFPEIRKESDGDGYLVRGYMGSLQVENEAFAAALEDFPTDARPVLKRAIVHADDVDNALRPQLAQARMDNVSADYSPGLVIFSGGFADAQRDALESVMAGVQQALGVPVPFRIIIADQIQATPRETNAAPSASLAWPASSEHSEPVPSGLTATEASGSAAQAEQGLQGLVVTGVTLSPMRFISVNTGERVFEGGLLPTGHTLEGIGDKELKLRKDGVLTIYKLRGANE